MFMDAASYAHITGLINGIEPLLDLDYALNNDVPKEPQEGSEN